MVTNYYPGTGEYVTPATISPRVFKFLKRYSDELSPHERQVVLTFNEFPFKDFVPMTPDGFNGGVKLPSHFIVPCIRFIDSKKYHLLGSLFFHSEFLQTKPEKFGRHMADCIKLYILALQNVNLSVVATVCPLSAVFHHAIEVLTQVPFMEEYDGPLVYKCGSDKEIVHIHDPKYVRDGFVRWFMLFDLQFTLNGKNFTASRYDITEALEFHNRPPVYQKSNCQSKYYEYISYCYFTEKTSVAIRRLIKLGYFQSQAIGTSIFINMFRQLFHRIYGLNNEPCEAFDFERMNEYIEFIKNISAAHTHMDESDDYQQDVAGSLPYQYPFVTQNQDNPLDYQKIYPQPEKSLESLTQKDMYESIMITTASGKTFVPANEPLPSKKSTKSKNKKKNRKDRKKLLLDSQTQESQRVEVKLFDDTELSLGNEIKVVEDDIKKSMSSKIMDVIPSKTESSTECCISLPIKPEHSSSPNFITRREDLRNPNLNENIRKYEKPNKCSTYKNIETSSIRDNSCEMALTTIPENIDLAILKPREFNLDDEIKEISYSISDPDESTDYQFDQISDYDERQGATGVRKTNINSVVNSYCHDNIASNAEVESLFQNYLTKGHIKDLMKPEPSAYSETQFESFIQFLKERSLQYTSFLKEKESSQSVSGDYVRISMKPDDKVDIQKIGAGDFKQPSLDSFGITKHKWPTTNVPLKEHSIPTDSDKPESLGIDFNKLQLAEPFTMPDVPNEKSSEYDKEMSENLKKLIGVDQETENIPPTDQLQKEKNILPERITLDLSDSSNGDQKLDEDFLKFEESVFEEASQKQMDLLSSYTKKPSSHSIFTPPSLQFLKKPDEKCDKEKSRYLNLQCGASSDSEGDYKIIDRIHEDNDETDQKSHSDCHCVSMDKSEFNSEYDDIDELNKHVKMIINKLEKDGRETIKSRNSATKEVTSRRGYVKKEIYHESGESLNTGAVKRTIFHRDKTEESTVSVTPKIVIKDSENSCDKSKIANTKASYKETLGVKSKKELKNVQQHESVIGSVSQAIKGFANIVDSQESEEEKNIKISKASLDFVFDLSKLRDEPDLKRRQKLFDLSYNRLCSTSFGKNAKNPNIQCKMKELKPVLERIAFPNEIATDTADDSILSHHINKTISSSENISSESNRFVREDVQNLWINNIKGIERLFRRLGDENIKELTPEIFKTYHVDFLMSFIQANGLHYENFPVLENCLPVDIPECFDTLKPMGSVILNDA